MPDIKKLTDTGTGDAQAAFKAGNQAAVTTNIATNVDFDAMDQADSWSPHAEVVKTDEGSGLKVVDNYASDSSNNDWSDNDTSSNWYDNSDYNSDITTDANPIDEKYGDADYDGSAENYNDSATGKKEEETTDQPIPTVETNAPESEEEQSTGNGEEDASAMGGKNAMAGPMEGGRKNADFVPDGTGVYVGLDIEGMNADRNAAGWNYNYEGYYVDADNNKVTKQVDEYGNETFVDEEGKPVEGNVYIVSGLGQWFNDDAKAFNYGIGKINSGEWMTEEEVQQHQQLFANLAYDYGTMADWVKGRLGECREELKYTDWSKYSEEEATAKKDSLVAQIMNYKGIYSDITTLQEGCKESYDLLVKRNELYGQYDDDKITTNVEDEVFKAIQSVSDAYDYFPEEYLKEFASYTDEEWDAFLESWKAGEPTAASNALLNGLIGGVSLGDPGNLHYTIGEGDNALSFDRNRWEGAGIELGKMREAAKATRDAVEQANAFVLLGRKYVGTEDKLDTWENIRKGLDVATLPADATPEQVKELEMEKAYADAKIHDIKQGAYYNQYKEASDEDIEKRIYELTYGTPEVKEAVETTNPAVAKLESELEKAKANYDAAVEAGKTTLAQSYASQVKSLEAQLAAEQAQSKGGAFGGRATELAKDAIDIIKGGSDKREDLTEDEKLELDMLTRIQRVRAYNEIQAHIKELEKLYPDGESINAWVADAQKKVDEEQAKIDALEQRYNEGHSFGLDRRDFESSDDYNSARLGYIEKAEESLKAAEKELADAEAYRLYNLKKQGNYDEMVAAGKEIIPDAEALESAMKEASNRVKTVGLYGEYMADPYEPLKAVGITGENADQLLNLLKNPNEKSITALLPNYTKEEGLFTQLAKAFLPDMGKLTVDGFTQDELNSYYYLLASEGFDSASKFALQINNENNAEYNNALFQRYMEYKDFNADYYGKAGVWASALVDPFAETVMGWTGVSDILKDAIDIAYYGSAVMDALPTIAQYAEWMQKGDAYELAKLYPEVEHLQDFYGVYSSIINSTVTMLTGQGIAQALGGMFGLSDIVMGGKDFVERFAGAFTDYAFFGSSASSRFRELKEQGVDDDIALYDSVMTGAFEVFFEHFSFEEFYHAKDVMSWHEAGFKRFMDWTVNTAKSAAIEGSEELFTNWGNRLGDSIFDGKGGFTSEFSKAENLRKEQLKGSGLSQEEIDKEAFKYALSEAIHEDAKSFVAGTASGGISVGARSAYNSYIDSHDLARWRTDAGKAYNDTKLADGKTGAQAFGEYFKDYQFIKPGQEGKYTEAQLNIVDGIKELSKKAAEGKASNEEVGRLEYLIEQFDPSIMTDFAWGNKEWFAQIRPGEVFNGYVNNMAPILGGRDKVAEYMAAVTANSAAGITNEVYHDFMAGLKQTDPNLTTDQLNQISMALGGVLAGSDLHAGKDSDALNAHTQAIIDFVTGSDGISNEGKMFIWNYLKDKVDQNIPVVPVTQVKGGPSQDWENANVNNGKFTIPPASEAKGTTTTEEAKEPAKIPPADQAKGETKEESQTEEEKPIPPAYVTFMQTIGMDPNVTTKNVGDALKNLIVGAWDKMREARRTTVEYNQALEKQNEGLAKLRADETNAAVAAALAEPGPDNAGTKIAHYRDANDSLTIGDKSMTRAEFVAEYTKGINGYTGLTVKGSTSASAANREFDRMLLAAVKNDGMTVEGVTASMTKFDLSTREPFKNGETKSEAKAEGEKTSEPTKEAEKPAEPKPGSGETKAEAKATIIPTAEEHQMRQEEKKSAEGKVSEDTQKAEEAKKATPIPTAEEKQMRQQEKKAAEGKVSEDTKKAEEKKAAALEKAQADLEKAEEEYSKATDEHKENLDTVGKDRNELEDLLKLQADLSTPDGAALDILGYVRANGKEVHTVFGQGTAYAIDLPNQVEVVVEYSRGSVGEKNPIVYMFTGDGKVTLVTGGKKGTRSFDSTAAMVAENKTWASPTKIIKALGDLKGDRVGSTLDLISQAHNNRMEDIDARIAELQGKVKDGEAAVKDSQAKLDTAGNDLNEAKKSAEVLSAEETDPAEAAQKEVADSKTAVADAHEKAEAAKTELEDFKKQYDTDSAERQKKIDQAIADEADKKKAASDAAAEEKTAKSEYKEASDAAKSKSKDGEERLRTAKIQGDYAQAARDLAEAQNKEKAARIEYERAKAAKDSAKNSKAKSIAQSAFSKAKKLFEAARKSLATAQEAFNESKTELDALQAEQKKTQDALAALDQKKNDAHQKTEDAKKALADARQVTSDLKKEQKTEQSKLKELERQAREANKAEKAAEDRLKQAEKAADKYKADGEKRTKQEQEKKEPVIPTKEQFDEKQSEKEQAPAPVEEATPVAEQQTVPEEATTKEPTVQETPATEDFKTEENLTATESGGDVNWRDWEDAVPNPDNGESITRAEYVERATNGFDGLDGISQITPLSFAEANDEFDDLLDYFKNGSNSQEDYGEDDSDMPPLPPQYSTGSTTQANEQAPKMAYTPQSVQSAVDIRAGGFVGLNPVIGVNERNWNDTIPSTNGTPISRAEYVAYAMSGKDAYSGKSIPPMSGAEANAHFDRLATIMVQDGGSIEFGPSGSIVTDMAITAELANAPAAVRAIAAELAELETEVARHITDPRKFLEARRNLNQARRQLQNVLGREIVDAAQAVTDRRNELRNQLQSVQSEIDTLHNAISGTAIHAMGYEGRMRDLRDQKQKILTQIYNLNAADTRYQAAARRAGNYRNEMYAADYYAYVGGVYGKAKSTNRNTGGNAHVGNTGGAGSSSGSVGGSAGSVSGAARASAGGSVKSAEQVLSESGAHLKGKVIFDSAGMTPQDIANNKELTSGMRYYILAALRNGLGRVIITQGQLTNGRQITDKNGKTKEQPIYAQRYTIQDGDREVSSVILNMQGHAEANMIHEIAHHMLAKMPEANKRALLTNIIENAFGGRDDLYRVVFNSYLPDYGIAYGAQFDESGKPPESLVYAVYEEMVADFYAGIHRYVGNPEVANAMAPFWDEVSFNTRLLFEAFGLEDYSRNKWLQQEYKPDETYNPESFTRTDTAFGQEFRQEQARAPAQQEDLPERGKIRFNPEKNAYEVRFSLDGEYETQEGTQPEIYNITGDPELNGQYSVVTEYDPFAKQTIIINNKSVKKTTNKDSSGNIIPATVRELRDEAFHKNKDFMAQYGEEGIEKVNNFFDKVAQYLREAEEKFEYLDFADINNATLKLDPVSNTLMLTSMVKNGEYEVNVDFGTICERRQALQSIVNELLRDAKYDDNGVGSVVLNAETLHKINTALRDAGINTQCLICFVETKRYNQQKQFGEFTNMWNTAVRARAKELGITPEHFNFQGDYKLTPEHIRKRREALKGYKQGGSTKDAVERLVGLLPAEDLKLLSVSDIISSKGRTNIAQQFPTLNSLILKKGGSAAPKPVYAFIPYNGEIESLNSPAGTKRKPISEDKRAEILQNYIKSIAGVRSQSFSDFIITHVFDHLQKTGALAAKNLAAHTYTKVLSRALLFGLTGEKINMSILFDIDPSVNQWYAGLNSETQDIYVDIENPRNRPYMFSDWRAREEGAAEWVQSFPWDDGVKTQNTEGYSKNTGMIGVALSYWHYKWLLADPEIRQVIGYHSSSYPAAIKNATKLFLATDYTPVQNVLSFNGFAKPNYEIPAGTPSYASAPQTVKLPKNTARTTAVSDNSFADIKAEFAKRVADPLNKGKTKAEIAHEFMQEMLDYADKNGLVFQTDLAEHGHGDFDLYGDVEKTQNPYETADDFLVYCFEKGYLPMFYEFATDPNYYKQLFDFNMFDRLSYNPETGLHEDTEDRKAYAPQEAVRMFDDEGNLAFPKDFIGILDKAAAQYNKEQGKVQGVINNDEFMDQMRGITENQNAPQFSVASDASAFFGQNNPIPSYDEVVSGAASYGGLPIHYEPNMHAEARNWTSYISVSDKFFQQPEDGQRYILNHEVAHNYSDELMGSNTYRWKEFSEAFIQEKEVPPSSAAYKQGRRSYWEGIYGDIGATALSETTTRALTEYLDDPQGLRQRSEAAYREIDQFMKSKLGLTENQNAPQFSLYDGIEDAAEEHFGTTENYTVAGYLLRDGKMLDFSGNHYGGGYGRNDLRTVDHNDVSEAFDLITNRTPSDAAGAFISRGNIRLSPEAPGVNLTAKVEPTPEQYNTLRDFIADRNTEDFYLDIMNSWTNHPVKTTYAKGVNPDKVINDIKAFYRDGTIPQQSTVNQFHGQFSIATEDVADQFRKLQEQYGDDARQMLLDQLREQSLTNPPPVQKLTNYRKVDTKETSQGSRLTKGQGTYFKNSALRDGMGRLYEFYRGTGNFEHTMFDFNSSRSGHAMFLTNNRDVAYSYAGSLTNRSYMDLDTIVPAEEVAPQLVTRLEDLVERVYGTRDIQAAINSIETWGDSEFLYAVEDILHMQRMGELEKQIERGNQVLGNLFTMLDNTRSEAEDEVQSLIDLVGTATKSGVATMLVNMERPYILDAQGSAWDAIPIDNEVADFLRAIGRDIKEGNRTRTNEIAMYAYAHGYDGIVIQDLMDVGLAGSGIVNRDSSLDMSSDVLAVFDSNQAKDIRNPNPTEDPDFRFSLLHDVVDTEGNVYDNVVRVTYPWDRSILSSAEEFDYYVQQMMAGQKITTIDDKGKPQDIVFANADDMVVKHGFEHPALSELSSGKKTGVRSWLVYLNAAEILDNSKFLRHDPQNPDWWNNHDWFDEHGWDRRTAYIMDKYNKIYPVTLYIANTNDGRKILYHAAVTTPLAKDVDIAATAANNPQENFRRFNKFAKPEGYVDRKAPVENEEKAFSLDNARAEYGLNFRDPTGELLERVFNGTKKYETRDYTDKRGNGKIQNAYLNKTMGIVQTGAGPAKLVGYWRLGDPELREYDWLSDPDNAKELGNDGTEFEAKPGDRKWVYPIEWAERVDPQEVTYGGNPRVKRLTPKGQFSLAIDESNTFDQFGDEVQLDDYNPSVTQSDLSNNLYYSEDGTTAYYQTDTGETIVLNDIGPDSPEARYINYLEANNNANNTDTTTAKPYTIPPATRNEYDGYNLREQDAGLRRGTEEVPTQNQEGTLRRTGDLGERYEQSKPQSSQPQGVSYALLLPDNSYTPFRNKNGDVITTAEAYPYGSMERIMIQAWDTGDFTAMQDQLDELFGDKENRDQILDIAEQINQQHPELTDQQREATQKLIEELRKQWGTMPSRKNPKRDVHLPKSIDGQTKIMKGAQTHAQEAETEWLSEETMYEALNNELLSYTPTSNADALKEAERYIKTHNGNYDALVQEVHGWLESKERIKPWQVAVGELLLKELETEGRAQQAMALVIDLTLIAHETGQALQAFNILRKATPRGQLYYLQGVVNQLNKQYADQISSGKMPKVELPKWAAQRMLACQTRQELDTVVEDIKNEIAKRLPISWGDRWNAWRYLSMLGNPRTHVRNMLGNAMFSPAVFIKDIVARGIENSMYNSGKLGSKVKAKGVDLSSDSEWMKFAMKDFDVMQKILVGEANGNKYADANDILSRRDIWGKEKWLGGRFLAWVDELNSMGLTKEDEVFLKMYYTRAFAEFLQARGVTEEAIKNKEFGAKPEDRKLIGEARAWATLEAQRNTYRDANAFAQWVNSMKRKNKAAYVLLEGLMPFTKTPMNILQRGIEYSPIGLVKSIIQLRRDLASPTKMTTSQAIDRFSAGLTGTAIMALGLLLSKLGILRGSGGFDKKKKELEELQGHQAWSVELFGKSYTIDWMAPAALPLFIGSAIYDMLTRDKDEEFSFEDMILAFAGIANPLSQLSMLDGINTMLTNVSNAEGTEQYAILAWSMLTSYAGQGVPTLFGQVARTFDPDRRSTYIQPGSANPMIQRFIQSSLQSKIPIWENKKMPYVDNWGRKDTNNNILTRALENFLSPGYFNHIIQTDVDTEIERLYGATKDGDLVPSKLQKHFQVEGEKKNLTAEEYEKYVTDRGQTAYGLLNDLFTSAYYSSLNDAEKAMKVKEVLNLSEELSKQDVDPNYVIKEDWMNMAKEVGLLDYMLIKDDLQLNRTHEQLFAYLSMNPDLNRDQIIAIVANEYAAPDKVASQMYDTFNYNITQEDNRYMQGIFAEELRKGFERLDADEDFQKADPYEQGRRMNTMYQEAQAETKRRYGEILDAEGRVKEVGSSTGLGNDVFEKALTLTAAEFNASYGEGNINLNSRNTENIVVNLDGKFVVIPSEGMTEEEAVKRYQETGENFGVFDTQARATSYSKKIVHDQAERIAKGWTPAADDIEAQSRWIGQSISGDKTIENPNRAGWNIVLDKDQKYERDERFREAWDDRCREVMESKAFNDLPTKELQGTMLKMAADALMDEINSQYATELYESGKATEEIGKPKNSSNEVLRQTFTIADESFDSIEEQAIWLAQLFHGESSVTIPDKPGYKVKLDEAQKAQLAGNEQSTWISTYMQSFENGNWTGKTQADKNAYRHSLMEDVQNQEGKKYYQYLIDNNIDYKIEVDVSGASNANFWTAIFDGTHSTEDIYDMLDERYMAKVGTSTQNYTLDRTQRQHRVTAYGEYLQENNIVEKIMDMPEEKRVKAFESFHDRAMKSSLNDVKQEFGIVRTTEAADNARKQQAGWSTNPYLNTPLDYNKPYTLPNTSAPVSYGGIPKANNNTTTTTTQTAPQQFIIPPANTSDDMTRFRRYF